MNVLEALATAFINTFGITQPTEKTKRQAAWFIMGLMVLVLIVIVLAVFALIRIL